MILTGMGTLDYVPYQETFYVRRCVRTLIVITKKPILKFGFEIFTMFVYVNSREFYLILFVFI